MELKIEEVSVKADIEERSVTPDSVVADDEQLVEELASEYNQFLNFDLSKDELKFSESVEDMLTKLDEFCSLTDMIRSDISLCLTKTLPGIQWKCQDMEAVFHKVDKLEAFVSVVRQNVSLMEDHVSRAEEQHGSFGGIMKKLSSIVSPKRKQAAESKSLQHPTFEPPTIFNTNSYFGVVSSRSDKQVKQTNTHTDTTNEGLTGDARRDVYQSVEKTEVVVHAEQSKVDDKPVVETLGESRVDDKSVEEKLGQSRVDDKSVEEKLGESRVDDKPVEEKLGESRVDDKSVEEKLGESRVDDKPVVEK